MSVKQFFDVVFGPSVTTVADGFVRREVVSASFFKNAQTIKTRTDANKNFAYADIFCGWTGGARGGINGSGGRFCTFGAGL